MAEGDGFENRCAGNRTGGSNPSASDLQLDAPSLHRSGYVIQADSETTMAFRSQSLPTMGEPGCGQLENGANFVFDWYDPNVVCGPNEQRYFRSPAIADTTTPGIENDCDASGTENMCDILNGLVDGLNLDGIPDLCE